MIFFCCKTIEKGLFKKSTPAGLIDGSDCHLGKGSLNLFEGL